MQITIRDAIFLDAPAIHRINQSALGYDYPLADTEARLAHILSLPQDRLFVAVLGDQVWGYIHGSAYECTYQPSMKNILAVGVDPEAQGKGLGKALLHHLEEWAKADGCAGVRLVSGIDREGAHAFYLRNGYFNRKNQKNFMKLFDVPKA